MKTFAKIAVGGLAAVVLAAAGGWLWATSTAEARMAQTFEVHEDEIPVPMPLGDDEIAALRAEKLAELEAAGTPTTLEDGTEVDVLADVDLDALALDRAVERGKHLVEARYVCVECHGDNFGGGVMIDDPAMGTLLGPNLTTGEGSVTADYTIVDWDRIVRHGVKPDGHPAVMPSEDFVNMSDRELSDIVAYVRTAEPVDNTVAKPTLGPVGTVLMAVGKLPISAELVHDHHADHMDEPPSPEDTLAFGRHILGVCSGCHRADFTGGPIAAGPPDWPPAANLTPHDEGLAGWTFEDFKSAMRDGTSRDGTPLKAPMSLIPKYAENMTDDELAAMWSYLEQADAKPTGG